MYIKKTKKTDSRTGKSYFAYSLIESPRTDKGPRQRVLLSLGTDLAIPEGELKMLAERIEELLSGYDKSILKKLNVLLSIIPPNSSIAFLSPRIFQKNRNFQPISIV